MQDVLGRVLTILIMGAPLAAAMLFRGFLAHFNPYSANRFLLSGKEGFVSTIPTLAMQRMLPTWLCRFFIRGRRIPYGALNYETKLLAARALSLGWGTKLPRFDTSPVKLGQAARPVINKHLAGTLGHLDRKTVMTHRFGLTLLIHDLLTHELQIPLLLTAGFVYQQGERLNYTPVEQVEKLLHSRSVVGPDFPLHIWLTLPGHEIVDATFWAAFPALTGSEERARRGVMLDPADWAARSYHPQWVGEAIVRRLGLLKENEGW
ncbi:hypothetical protein ABIE09_001767 [Lysobacter enzymogenes]